MVRFFHYINDIMLTSDSLSALEAAAPALVAYLQKCGWIINSNKVQKPGLSVKFLGVVWSGRTQLIPDVVTDKIQAFPTLTTVKDL